MSDAVTFPIIYGLEFQSRSLVGLYSEKDEIRFAAGTQSIKSMNQLHLITYNDESHAMTSDIFNHYDGEIWGLTAMASNPEVLITTFSSLHNNFSEIKMLANLWKLPLSGNTHVNANLEFLTQLPTIESGDVKQVISCPNEETKNLIALVDGNLVLMGCKGSEFNVISKGRLDSRGHCKFNVGSWSPHHGTKQVVTASETNIYGWDINSMKISYNIENSHSHMVRDIDHNPNRQYCIVSSGDDCFIKIWDLRNTRQGPVKEIDEHTHWVWKAKYNPFHDELILSCGSDSMVALHIAQSVSSESHCKSLSDEEDDSFAKNNFMDGLIQTYEEHEDSVYVVDWSPVDPWIFSSLSYDGRLVINQVPKRVKYDILL